MLRLAGIRTFKDLLDREPDDEWGPRLYRQICQSDVMFLYWSAAARKSRWVAREWAYALESRPTQGYIKPIMIEGPPHVPLPRELAHVNLNAESSASSKPPLTG
ncbi:MAG: toll/interleukin-1 receptor domain-containing protein [Armatimonadota bacterium]